jgi:hypothetical protein
MGFLLSRAVMSLLLSALCVALSVVIYSELVAPDSPAVPQVAPKAQTVMPPPPSIKTLPPIDAYAEVSQRPLFSPTRQPAPPQATPDTAGNVNGFFVTAIVLDGNQRVATIQHGRPPALARVVEGQTVEGWIVQSIQAEGVVLQRGGMAQELKLKDRPPSQRPQALPEPQGQPQPVPQPQPQLQFRQQRDRG